MVEFYCRTGFKSERLWVQPVLHLRCVLEQDDLLPIYWYSYSSGSVGLFRSCVMAENVLIGALRFK